MSFVVDKTHHIFCSFRQCADRCTCSNTPTRKFLGHIFLLTFLAGFVDFVWMLAICVCVDM